MRFKTAGGYASGLERLVCEDLKKRKVKFQYEPDRLVYMRPISGASCAACTSKLVWRKSHYTPDIKLQDGSYIEVKGRFTSANRQRMYDFKRDQPGVRVRILFAADNWTTAVKRERYSDWAKRHGFEYAIGKRVPDVWVKA